MINNYITYTNKRISDSCTHHRGQGVKVRCDIGELKKSENWSTSSSSRKNMRSIIRTSVSAIIIFLSQTDSYLPINDTSNAQFNV